LFFSSSFGPILYHQMLSAVVWSQATVSSSRTAKPSVPFGRWYKGQEASMWSAVCSSASQLQFAEVTKPHLCIVERKSPTPVRRRFSLKHEGLGRVIPGDERNKCVEARCMFLLFGVLLLCWKEVKENEQTLLLDFQEQGVHFIIALTHMRWPNDMRLARNVQEIDIILGGHDHEYGVKDIDCKLIVLCELHTSVL